MTFEEHRAYLSHSLLENSFFCYLTEPPDLWKSARFQEESTLLPLCESWSKVMEKPRLLQHVVRTWQGERRGEIGIRQAVLQLYEQSKKGKRFRTKSTFPSKETIESWLEDIGEFILRIDPDAGHSTRVPDLVLINFWRSSLALYDFVQGLRLGGPRFWNYFEPYR
jgi:hypothetical protein